MIPLEELEKGEIYIINLSHPRLGENVFYIGTFVGVISRKKAQEKGFDNSTLDDDNPMAYFTQVIELPEFEPIPTKVFGDDYYFEIPEDDDLERYQEYLQRKRTEREQEHLQRELTRQHKLPLDSRVHRKYVTREPPGITINSWYTYGELKRKKKRTRRKRTRRKRKV